MESCRSGTAINPYWVRLMLSVGKQLDALILGDDTAFSGANIVRMGVQLAFGMAAIVRVAVAGVVGFVGLVAPHIIRPFFGYAVPFVFAICHFGFNSAGCRRFTYTSHTNDDGIKTWRRNGIVRCAIFHLLAFKGMALPDLPKEPH